MKKIRTEFSKKQRECGYYRNYQRKNKDKFNFYAQTRRAKRNNLNSDLTKEQWVETLKEFNNKCAYCGTSNEESIKKYGQALHQEHVISVNKGGDYTKSNIIPACESCNCKKHDDEFEQWYYRQEFYDKDKEKKIIEFINKYKNN
jgi:5-methylcytosine-specific restriction endonuclease McrA